MSLVELVASDVEQATPAFEQFHQRFADNFATTTRNMSTQAKQYLQGQLTCQESGNLWVFEKTVPYAKSQSLHHFISNSPWKDEPILDSVTQTVKSRIGSATNGSIHIDESGFEKDGNNSVGVARQYCGRLGKVDNCQVGVFLGYTVSSHRLLLDRRLYLPKEWISDSERLKKCGVPEEIEFQTKAELGLELIRIAQQRDLPYAWIGFDCHYGQQPWLLKTLEQEGQTYIADIPVTTRVWLTPPLVHVPKRAGNRGRIPTQPKVADNQPTPIEVSTLRQQLDNGKWQRVFVRETERGELWVKLAVLRVYPVRDELPGPATWLIVRKDEHSGEIKYQLSNAKENTPFEQFAAMSHSRYWIERAIQDAKGEAGMDEYQLRGWRGWHHHMTMTILAMLFLLELHLDWKPKALHLTLRDVREILEVILPKREITKHEIIQLIDQKHKARLSARRSHTRKRKRGRRK